MAWVRTSLDAIAIERAGDPGPVVLRRLSNAEYTYTIRDLTGVESLDPAKEFPVDGAAGEGFTNTGQSLVMSPSLVTKYLDAGKAIASHAVLLPDGIRFSPNTTRRDWTEEILAEIRKLYAEYTVASSSGNVVQQGLALDKGVAGIIPLEKYFAASLVARDAAISMEDLARQRGLSARYLGALMKSLSGGEPSPLLDQIRARWRFATPDDVPAIASKIAGWQKALWKFSNVGHIGKVGGPKSWMEPASPEDSQLKVVSESALEQFRQLFPAALCYSKIVPVDEVVTLTLFHREDDQLSRLMLDDAQKAKLDRLWSELRFLSQDALTLVDAFEQIWQYSSQDGPNAPNGDERLKPLGVVIKQRAAEFSQRLVETQPRHIEAVLEFAERAYRHPLGEGEKAELRALYGKLREQELPHEEAIRLLLARVLVGPAFLYKAERQGPGKGQSPVGDWELATRLSYFLWSSAPDAELRAIAASGKLHEAEVLLAQTQRMLADARIRRLATEFACSWLHIHDFDTLDEKSERHFPEFAALRGAMYEESIRFFTDLFQANRSVLSILDADHTFVNGALAKHYGIPGIEGEEWRRVDGLRKFSRGGVLGQAATLAKQSGASRTSPILRGNWVAEALLGDKLPRPPKDVPRLPEDEATETLTVRQLTEKHSTDPRCSGCHVRIDPFGFALENFDAIGRFREHDLGNHSIDANAKVLDGTELKGIKGLRDYLLTKRRDAFLRQFTRKLLGYSLGRAVQLSDEPLIKEIQTQLAANNYRIHTAIALIVSSRQFREIRGRDGAMDD